MDLEEAKGHTTGLLEAAKTPAANVQNHSKENGTSVLDRLREKAHKIDNYIGNAAARATSNTKGRDGGAGNRPTRLASRSDGRRTDHAIDRLCALGFSVVAVRHALQVCSGRVEDAGAWLLDDANSEQIIQAEVAAREVEPLRVGSIVRIHGLRGATHLNGIQVTLRKWDDESERWVLQLPDGSVKAIRPKNLDHPGALGRQGGDRTSLQRQLAELIGDRSPGVAQFLDALTEEELLEVIASLTLDQRGKAAAKRVDASVGSSGISEAEAEAEEEARRVRGPRVDEAEADAEARSERSSRADAEAVKQQSLAAECTELEQQLRESAERIATEESAQQRRAEEFEVRERVLSESQERWHAEAEAEASQVRALECDPRGSAEVPRQEVSVAESLADQRAEIERLQSKAQCALRELAERQEAALRVADERELRLLEAEEEQLHIRRALAQEHQRLERERKKVFMLQRSLIENANSAAAASSARGASGSGADGRFEMALDDSDAEGGRPRRHEPVSRKMSKGRAPTTPSDVAAVAALATAGATDAVGADGASAEDEEDDTECGGDPIGQVGDEHEEGEEVWDLDWSNLKGTPGEASTVERGFGPARRLEPEHGVATSSEAVKTVLHVNAADNGEVPSSGFAPPSRQSAAAMTPEDAKLPTEVAADAG
eukprot:TRINITY_DN8299_c0_g1_i1.p1 TRINITY_DN8299_c0_g1~~TRINITY_DN8299_c0_g1_i1.p1  ORF type:complete len:663 (-),score=176.63 TRINITY_DN8299_c0_g1_i1:105-2093(-)